MEHPSLKQATKLAKQQMKKKGGKPGQSIISLAKADDEEGKDVRQNVTFYEQSRAFADFMLEVSGDTTLFAKVAQAYADGSTIGTWLADNGKSYGLSSTVGGLENQFQAWLKDNYDVAENT